MASPEEKTLCFVSWNVDGVVTKINSKSKLLFEIEELSRQGAEIVFLQETHIGSENYRAFDEIADGWKCFFTVYDTASKGVAILIKNDVPFQYICHDEDYSGGYLVLFCYIQNELFTLVNVYNHKHDRNILNRLQDYLRETAEGVLVVGGDFNTVLDRTVDRQSGALKNKDNTSRNTFQKFTASLNLMDTWAHLHPTEKTFTHYQKGESKNGSYECFSRLDMFLMPEDIITRVNDVTICEAKEIQDSTRDSNMRNISDHKLVRLTLNKGLNPTDKKIPDVALRLKEFKYIRDKNVGKINGAEILSVIRSLTDSKQLKSNRGEEFQLYKRYRCQITEILKKYFNIFLYSKQIPDEFKLKHDATSTRKVFNVNYLIFTMILAKRLSILLVHPDNNIQPNPDCYIVTFIENPVKINWTFLKKILSTLYNNCKSQTIHQRDLSILEGLAAASETGNFSILDMLLPEVDFRELQEGCPLTRPILSSILKYLMIRINEIGYTTHICQFRQVVVIHKNNIDVFPKVQSLFPEFSENGIKMNIFQWDNS